MFLYDEHQGEAKRDACEEEIISGGVPVLGLYHTIPIDQVIEGRGELQPKAVGEVHIGAANQGEVQAFCLEFVQIGQFRVLELGWSAMKSHKNVGQLSAQEVDIRPDVPFAVFGINGIAGGDIGVFPVVHTDAEVVCRCHFESERQDTADRTAQAAGATDFVAGDHLMDAQLGAGCDHHIPLYERLGLGKQRQQKEKKEGFEPLHKCS